MAPEHTAPPTLRAWRLSQAGFSPAARLLLLLAAAVAATLPVAAAVSSSRP